jgi:hypothetical protein
MSFSTPLHASHNEPPHPYIDPGLVVDSLTGVHNETAMCILFANKNYV